MHIIMCMHLAMFTIIIMICHLKPVHACVSRNVTEVRKLGMMISSDKEHEAARGVYTHARASINKECQNI